MEPILLRASEESKNQRLDAFLASSLDGLTRSQATRLIESGEVAVNGRAVSKSYKLAGGEDIAVTLPEPEPVEAVPQDIPLDVVYEDADVIVINKPSGMVVHPAPGHPDGTLVNALLYHCAGTLSGVGGALRPGIVHRIDRDTSGLIIAAKNDAAHQYLSAQLADHTLARTYECIVERAHRAPSDRPQAHGGGRRRARGGHALGGHRPLSGLYPRPLPARNGTHTPDPRPHGLHRASHSRRHGVRRKERGPRPDGAMPARGRPALSPSAHARGRGAFLSPVGGIYKDAAKNQEINCTRYGAKQGERSLWQRTLPFCYAVICTNMRTSPRSRGPP